MPPTLLILAAGLGTRFGGPKALAEVGPGGTTLLELAVCDALRAGLGPPVIVVRPDLESPLREHFARRLGSGVGAAWVRQDEALGTGHAVLCAESWLSGPFVVANADDFYGASSYAALGRHLGDPTGDNLLTVYRLRDTLSSAGGVSRAVVRCDAAGYLESLSELLDVRASEGGAVGRTASGERVTLSGAEPVSMNLWGLRPELFPALRAAFDRFRARARPAPDEFRLNEAIDVLIGRGETTVRVISASEEWFGLTWAEDLALVRDRIASRIARGDAPATFRSVLREPSRRAEDG